MVGTPEAPPQLEAPPYGIHTGTSGHTQHLELPLPLVLQQPDVIRQPKFVALHCVPPQLMPQVDWAMITYALFSVAERENLLRQNNLN